MQIVPKIRYAMTGRVADSNVIAPKEEDAEVRVLTNLSSTEDGQH